MLFRSHFGIHMPDTTDLPSVTTVPTPSSADTVTDLPKASTVTISSDNPSTSPTQSVPPSQSSALPSQSSAPPSQDQITSSTSDLSILVDKLELSPKPESDPHTDWVSRIPQLEDVELTLPSIPPSYLLLTSPADRVTVSLYCTYSRVCLCVRDTDGISPQQDTGSQASCVMPSSRSAVHSVQVERVTCLTEPGAVNTTLLVQTSSAVSTVSR